MYTVILKKNEEKRIMGGHPWVYANEVARIEGRDAQGSIARVTDFQGRFIGYGFINHASKIIVRILTRDETPIDEAFFYRRLKTSNDYRLSLGYKNNYRAVFGESDLLPGLIVDKYGDCLSVQILSLGMEVRKEMLLKILIDIFRPQGIYERSDVPVRVKEGLKEVKQLLYGNVPETVTIEENGIKMQIDLMNGQKTGYFLDQKENRDNLKYYVQNRDVLDCFCNIGGFSLCASKYGAKAVTAVDISEAAVNSVVSNAKLNGFTNITAIKADVFEQLKGYKAENRKFDLIILDPPAFIKSKDSVKSGYYGYRELNTLALKLLNKGGFLITCSCSQPLSLNMFLEMIRESVLESKVYGRLVEVRSQGKDHAILIGTEESAYLKVAVVQVIDA
jgi:23S rRNA (cytosine1962-C5)-methyltransferase